jgi:hypothetical protein
MIKIITEKLTQCPSYLKKGDEALAKRFGCSPKTIRRIKTQLKDVKREYISSL